MKVLTVVGARPQFIKSFSVSRAIRDDQEEVLVHTGQHYDDELSSVFFDELDMDEPDYHLGVGSDTHGKQTAAMLEEIEAIVCDEAPDVVLLYGDTNSTLAGAIAGSKLDPTIAHVEAGLRSHNREMPEEINRIVTDHVSDILFAPSESAVESLQNEGISESVYNVGDVMYDSILWAKDIARDESEILEQVGVQDGEFVLSTVHRAANTDTKSNLEAIVDALSQVESQVVLPLHPRTKEKLKEFDLWDHATAELEIIDPAGYLDFVRLLDAADVVATDSGGVQKEAFYLDTPCVTMREETEWVETVESGWNVLVGAEKETIVHEIEAVSLPDEKPTPYGGGSAAEKIIKKIQEYN
ncbi:non-hydrolyzing UDP-N-acetylglucosamine 2-epimerase [Haloferax volcanii]|uniref:non-hydrolyzing UDP-N-acetylglucosamine 2-epimerase n=1 Tax=Haloferax volcanii TaxID=2246 RepID=UPI00349FC786